ncbi:hypothetical protein [Pannonibacter tanglangensis]|uniref:Uncharacterized protein n=1 Tax=Pannonibacter tanglangensis TaxID=2750084 RepID=A0ABW9ZGK5_9HYPH|nr:hypothetical protein [Pannonibacter sp. XCT-34]NBN62781.1 hypothetical protein [Pannonibacter sp. XCT-34]
MAKTPAAPAAPEYEDLANYRVALKRPVTIGAGTKLLPRYVHEIRGRVLKTIDPEHVDHVEPADS